MTRTSVVSLLLVSLILCGGTGCDTIIGFFWEPAADTDNPSSHKKAGLSFRYPGNWEITEDSMILTVRTLNVESKGNALAIIQHYPAGMEQEIDELAGDFLSAMNEELGQGWKKMLGARQGGVHSFKEPFMGVTGQGRRVQLTLSLLGERQTMAIEVRLAKLKKGTVVLITLIAAEDRRKAQPGFDLIRKSLKLK